MPAWTAGFLSQAKKKKQTYNPYGRACCLTNMLHLSGELAVANRTRTPTLCFRGVFIRFFLSLSLTSAVFPSAEGVKQRMCQKHMRWCVSARCAVLVPAVVVVVLHWSWPRVLLFIPLLQLSLLCLRRGRRSGCTWRSVRSSQLCRMSRAGSTRPGTLAAENKGQEEHSGSVQPSGQRTSASCEIRA